MAHLSREVKQVNDEADVIEFEGIGAWRSSQENLHDVIGERRQWYSTIAQHFSCGLVHLVPLS